MPSQPAAHCVGVLGKAAATDLFFKMPCEVKSYTLTDFKVTFFTSETAFVTYKGRNGRELRRQRDSDCVGERCLRETSRSMAQGISSGDPGADTRRRVVPRAVEND